MVKRQRSRRRCRMSRTPCAVGRRAWPPPVAGGPPAVTDSTTAPTISAAAWRSPAGRVTADRRRSATSLGVSGLRQQPHNHQLFTGGSGNFRYGAVPSPRLSSSTLPSTPLPFPLEVGSPLNDLWDLGERCKLPQRVAERSPGRKGIWCTLKLFYSRTVKISQQLTWPKVQRPDGTNGHTDRQAVRQINGRTRYRYVDPAAY